MTLRLRAINGADEEILARLHAASWRHAYRGILADAFLDGDLLAERRDAWRHKLADERRGLGWIAEQGQDATGFVFIEPYADVRWGTLIDNLYVLPACQKRGVGSRLLGAVRMWAMADSPSSRLHLYVYAANDAARSYYRRRGGWEVERLQRRAVDGRELAEYRVTWPSAFAMT